jgi:hypothetical protein
MTNVLRRTLLSLLAVTATAAAVLTLALSIGNPSSTSIPAVLELAVAMFWISAILHGAVAAALAGAWVAARLASGRALRGDPSRFLLSGLIAFDVTWILWNRLGMAHQYVSVRPFLTWTGVAQNLALGAIATLIVLIGVRAGGARRLLRPLAAVAVVSLIAGVWGWSAVEETSHRVYSMDRVREAAPVVSPEAHVSSRSEETPVIVLGLDGLNWSTMVPLLELGKLPNLAQLIRTGAYGYLNNGRESLSARIWSTIFSGRPPAEHGILGFTKLVLPRSGASFANLLLHHPSIDTFYGLSHLLTKIPQPGLWRLEQMGSRDRKVKMLWDVVSEHEKKVVVANVITNIPVHRVDGAMIEYRESADLSNAYPPALVDRWRPTPYRDPSGRTPEGFEDYHRRLREEAAFTLELFQEHDVDLGIYYTHFVDTASHWNWDFHSRGRFLLDDLPKGMEDQAWENLVRESCESPAFLAYALLDQTIGDFLESFPEAVFLVCSDHGWTYSGYEHFGSPDGVLIVSGPGVRRGAPLRGCRSEDVTPTVLGLLGIPIAESLAGCFLTEAFLNPPPLLAGEPYGPPDHEGGGSVEDREELERLHALGYLN